MVPPVEYELLQNSSAIQSVRISRDVRCQQVDQQMMKWRLEVGVYALVRRAVGRAWFWKWRLRPTSSGCRLPPPASDRQVNNVRRSDTPEQILPVDGLERAHCPRFRRTVVGSNRGPATTETDIRWSSQFEPGNPHFLVARNTNSFAIAALCSPGLHTHGIHHLGPRSTWRATVRTLARRSSARCH